MEKPAVAIVDYDPNWPVMFQKEKDLILSKIGNYIVAFEHIGSTFVPGLGAKPIVNILIGISSLERGKRVPQWLSSQKGKQCACLLLFDSAILASSSTLLE